MEDEEKNLPAEMTAEVVQPDKPVVSERKVNRVLLEFLVHGVEGDKKKIKKMMDAMQDQMHRARKGKYCRILWYIDKGEKTAEEKREWLIENSKSKYYVFTKENYTVPKDFVKETLFKIKRLEDAVTAMKMAGIVIGKKPVADAVETVEPIEETNENKLKVVE